jgi:hypothetical protein
MKSRATKISARANLAILASVTLFSDCYTALQPDNRTDGPLGYEAGGEAQPTKLDGAEPKVDGVIDGPADAPVGYDGGGIDQGAAEAGGGGGAVDSGRGAEDSAIGAGGVTGAGGTGMAGNAGAGGVLGAGGAAGVLGSGGVSGAGGLVTAGGAVGTGGKGTGGSGTGGSGTGGTTCQPRSRDCTSTADNDCNGTPDNQETTYCACPAGETRACQEHPGYDGTGICKAGSQTCAASTDKTTSSWGACTGAVGPATEVCDAAGLDENCNGQSNEGCECVNGTAVSCDCGPATTCTNGKKGTCSQSKVTWYLDSDGDGYGDPARPALVCPNTSGYVSNHDDCDDSSSGASFYPGVSTCAADYITRKWCETGGGGVTKTEACAYGCAGGQCHPSSDGTIGIPGYVSCTTTHTPKCDTTSGCYWGDGSCGSGIHCDGPSDCPTGQKCYYYMERGMGGSDCASAKPKDYYLEVCDPMASTCNCLLEQGLGVFYTCQ